MIFQDHQLQAFHDAWKNHRDEVDIHIKRFTKHIEAEENRWEEIIKATQKNNELIKEHVESYKSQEKVLNDLIDLYRTGQAGIRIGSAVGKFAIWLASLGALSGLGHFIIVHFFSGKPPP